MPGVGAIAPHYFDMEDARGTDHDGFQWRAETVINGEQYRDGRLF